MLPISNMHQARVVRYQHFSFSHNVFKKLLKVPIAANYKEFVYKIKVNSIHTILKYGDYHDFMDSHGNSAVLKSSSQWQLKEC